jgi:hypothetical protein
MDTQQRERKRGRITKRGEGRRSRVASIAEV